jgi:hypothetical protein
MIAFRKRGSQHPSGDCHQKPPENYGPGSVRLNQAYFREFSGKGLKILPSWWSYLADAYRLSRAEMLSFLYFEWCFVPVSVFRTWEPCMSDDIRDVRKKWNYNHSRIKLAD